MEKPVANDAGKQRMLKFSKTCSLSHLLEFEYMGPIFKLLYDNTYNPSFDFQNLMSNTGNDHAENFQLGEMAT